jgi:hypothetical protein
MQLLRRNKREALGKVEAHLVPENRLRPRASPVGFLDAFMQDAGEEIVILLHGRQMVGLAV